MDPLSQRLFAEDSTATWANPTREWENEQVVRQVFGKRLDPTGMARIVAAPSGSETVVHVHKKEGVVEVIASKPGSSQKEFHLRRWFKRSNGQCLAAHVGLITLGLGAGAGLRLFAREVLAYRETGIRMISTKAARIAATDDLPEQFGYYVWALYGFRLEFNESVMSRLPPEFAQVTNSHDLFAAGANAREWWKQNGDTSIGSFDTVEGSTHSGMLRRIMEQKQVDVTP